MKTTPFFLLIILLASCGSAKMLELSGRASLKGTEVSQQALEVFDLLSQQADIDKLQQDRVKILINPNPATMGLPDTKAQDFSSQIATRVKAYQSLMETYKSFGLLTDSRFGEKTKEAFDALKGSYQAIEQLPDLPPAVANKLPEVAKMISQSIQAKKIKKHNLILYNLSQLYLTLWNEDQKIWNDYIDLIYNTYASGLNTIDSKRFDTEKIKAESKEPFSDAAIVILLFRLDYRNEILKQRNEVKKHLSDFGKALSELNQVHSEIAKTKTDISDVASLLNSIENILKQ